MSTPVLPGEVFPGPVFPDPVFPGPGTEPGTVETGAYRHVAPAPIERRGASDLYTLVKAFEAMED